MRILASWSVTGSPETSSTTRWRMPTNGHGGVYTSVTGGAGAAPGALDESAGGRGGDVGCDQVPAQRAVLRRGSDRARGPGPDPGGRAARTVGRQPAGVGFRGLHRPGA